MMFSLYSRNISDNNINDKNFLHDRWFNAKKSLYERKAYSKACAMLPLRDSFIKIALEHAYMKKLLNASNLLCY